MSSANRGRRDAIHQRIKQLQTRLCGFDINEEPEYLDHAVDRVLPWFVREFGKRVPRIEAAVVHSHEHFLTPQVALYSTADELHFIAIDYRFFNFIFEVNRWVLLQVFAELDGDKSADTFKSNARQVVGQFFRFDHGLLHLVDKEPDKSTLNAFTSYRVEQARDAFGYAQVLFLIAHEYAHYLMDHELEWHRLPKPGTADNDYQGFACLSPRQEEELAADEIGAKVTLDVLRDDEELINLERNLAVAGVDLLFVPCAGRRSSSSTTVAASSRCPDCGGQADRRISSVTTLPRNDAGTHGSHTRQYGASNRRRESPRGLKVCS